MEIKIVEHSGDEVITVVKKYDALETLTRLKEAQSHDTAEYLVAIGEVIMDARSIKKIAPVYE